MKPKSLNLFIAAFAGCVLATPVVAQTNLAWDGSKTTAWDDFRNWGGSGSGSVPDDATEVAVFSSITTRDPATFVSAFTIGGFSLTGGEA